MLITLPSVDPELYRYIDDNILPLYQDFDAAHQRDHAERVIANSFDLAKHYDVNPSMLFAIAAFHDTGLQCGRKLHHLVSGRIVRTDPQLPRWFTSQQLEVMAQAVEDHRASIGYRPRSLYGLIVAEADRDIDPLGILRRTVQYGIDHYLDLDSEGHWQRTVQHLREKYDEGGYLQLFIPQSPNAERLAELRTIIHNPALLRQHFERLYSEALKEKTHFNIS